MAGKWLIRIFREENPREILFAVWAESFRTKSGAEYRKQELKQILGKNYSIDYIYTSSDNEYTGKQDINGRLYNFEGGNAELIQRLLGDKKW